MRRAALITFAVALAAFIAFAAIPFMTRKRDFPASITSPPPRDVVALDVVAPGQRLCMDRITIEPRSGVARFRIGTYGKPGPALTVSLSGPGYAATKRIAAGWADNALQQVTVPHPARPELVTVCWRNRGRIRVALYSAAGRPRSDVTLNGRRVPSDPVFGFWEARPQSIADRATVTAERITAFRGPFAHTWLVWAAVVAALVALVGGMAGALWLSGD
jgi:hypothetical protein